MFFFLRKQKELTAMSMVPWRVVPLRHSLPTADAGAPLAVVVTASACSPHVFAD